MTKNNTQKRILITGITGQDGSYLSELLLEKGYEVYGLERRKALEDQTVKRKNSAIIIPGDITNFASVYEAIVETTPDKIYHLAAQSDVKYSSEDPSSTLDINIWGTLNLLRAMKKIVPKSKLYFAGSSEMFGKVKETPQNENTPFHPRSEYGVSKCAGFDLCRLYRESYGLFISNGILFNHESPIRGKEFVTRKISDLVAKIYTEEDKVLEIGNMDSKRDWGYAKEYVEAMWLMLQRDKPDDYVIGTGETHTVREFIEESFKIIGMPLNWKGEGVNEVGLNKGKILVKVNPKFYRPSEVDILLADPSKAKRELGWEAKTKFKDLVRMMVESDIASQKLKLI